MKNAIKEMLVTNAGSEASYHIILKRILVRADTVEAWKTFAVDRYILASL